MTPGPALDRLVNEIMYGESPAAVFPFSTSPIFLHQLMKWASERYTVHAEFSQRVREWVFELVPDSPTCVPPQPMGHILRNVGRHEQPFVALCLAIVSTKETP